jgi:hypothetical protein
MGLNNKRGFFFVILTIFLLSIFIFSYTFYSNVAERKATQARVESMNNFIFSLEEDLSRNLYIFGYRSIFLVEDTIVSTGSYVSGLQDIFLAGFINSTFYGTQSELLIDSYESAIISQAKNYGEKINVDINISTNSFQVTQDDPWNVKFIWNISLNVSDKNGLADWVINDSIVAYVPISNFEDPLYFVSTNGLVARKISLSNFSPIYISGGSTSNISLFLSNKQYSSSIYSPSFLNRLEGNKSANIYGVESFVSLTELATQGVPITDKSILDYVYFSTNSPSPLCTLSGMPSWFKVDLTNAARYNITC